MAIAGFNQMKHQKGFTLIESMVVIVLIGALMLIGMRTIGGSSDSANSAAMRSAAKSLADGASYLHSNLGIGLRNLGSTAFTNGTAPLLEVLIEGESAVAVAQRERYRSIGMRPVSNDFGGTAAGRTFMGYPVSLYAAGGGSTPAVTGAATCPTRMICVAFGGVPIELVEALSSQLGHAWVDAKTSGTDVQWTGGTTKTVTFMFVP